MQRLTCHVAMPAVLAARQRFCSAPRIIHPSNGASTLLPLRSPECARHEADRPQSRYVLPGPGVGATLVLPACAARLRPDALSPCHLSLCCLQCNEASFQVHIMCCLQHPPAGSKGDSPKLSLSLMTSGKDARATLRHCRTPLVQQLRGCTQGI